MKWCRTIGFLVLSLLISGFLSSGNSPGLSLLPCCLANETNTALQDRNSIYEWENELLGFVNRERTNRGLAPLGRDETLMHLARNQSRNMAEQGFISHNRPSGDLQTRMSRAGYVYKVARENVASARTVSKAHRALLNSPNHKSNILAPDVTRIGIGVVMDPASPCGEYLYITEVFASPREAYEPSAVKNLLEDRISDLRRRGTWAMSPDPMLENIASRSLLSLGATYDRKDLQSLLAASASELQEQGDTGLSQLKVSVQLLHDPENLSIPSSGSKGQVNTYGTAVRRVTDNRNQPAFLVLTLLGIAR